MVELPETPPDNPLADLHALVPQALGVLIEARIAAATEKASTADRLWFKRHPNRRLRVRPPFPDEAAAIAAGAKTKFKADECASIIVGAIDDGVRIRIAMLRRPGVEIQWARLEAATDVELLQIIEQSLNQS